KREINPTELKKNLEQRGIIIKTPSLSSLSEEAPQAYKDIETVVTVVQNLGIARIISKLKPLAVIKG
ncbi:MAG: RtcB family protein, partial [Candidatus Kapaibacteriota bacterium]